MVSVQKLRLAINQMSALSAGTVEVQGFSAKIILAINQISALSAGTVEVHGFSAKI